MALRSNVEDSYRARQVRFDDVVISSSSKTLPVEGQNRLAMAMAEMLLFVLLYGRRQS